MISLSPPNQKPRECGVFGLAEREGFEPSIRGYRIHAFQACAFNHSATSPIFRYLMTLKQYRVTLTDEGVKRREFKVKAEESPMTTSGSSCSISPLMFGSAELYYAALRCAANLVSKLTSPRGKLQISSTQSPCSTNL